MSAHVGDGGRPLSFNGTNDDDAGHPARPPACATPPTTRSGQTSTTKRRRLDEAAATRLGPLPGNTRDGDAPGAQHSPSVLRALRQDIERAQELERSLEATSRLSAENARLRVQLAATEHSVAQLRADVDALKAESKRQREAYYHLERVAVYGGTGLLNPAAQPARRPMPAHVSSSETDEDSAGAFDSPSVAAHRAPGASPVPPAPAPATREAATMTEPAAVALQGHRDAAENNVHGDTASSRRGAASSDVPPTLVESEVAAAQGGGSPPSARAPAPEGAPSDTQTPQLVADATPRSRDPSREMRRLVSILTRIFPYSKPATPVGAMTVKAVKEHLAAVLGRAPQPDWGLRERGRADYIAQLLTFGSGRQVTEAQAARCFRYTQGVGWERVDAGFRAIGMMDDPPWTWKLPLQQHVRGDTGRLQPAPSFRPPQPSPPVLLRIRSEANPATAPQGGSGMTEMRNATESLVLIRGAVGHSEPVAPPSGPVQVPAEIQQALELQGAALREQWHTLLAHPATARLAVGRRGRCVESVLGGLVLGALRPTGQPWRTGRGALKVFPLRKESTFGNSLPDYACRKYAGGERTVSATCKPCLACILLANYGAGRMFCLHAPRKDEIWRRGDVLQERDVVAGGDGSFEPDPCESGLGDWALILQALEEQLVSPELTAAVLDCVRGGVLEGVFGREACDDCEELLVKVPAYRAVQEWLGRGKDEWAWTHG
ncbi:unnamed protein product [Pedinophyceae sp. YPF-701]|nr:unnamed protein product [Pedinophyceae sp. YPF-701]